MFEKILLAVDGSEQALRAAALAGELARSHGSESIRIVTVYDAVPGFLGEREQDAIIAAHTRSSEAILAKAKERLGAGGPKIETEILSGSPAEAIVETAKARDVGLIVMGSRGMSDLAGLFLGSQSHKVAAKAPCPVLLVR